MCRIDDAERYEFAAIVRPKARKQHKCCECGRAILPGERYESMSGKLDGEIERLKTCEHCASARDWLITHCGGFVFTQVDEELREHFHEGYRADRVGRLIIGIKRQWKAFRGGMMPVPVVAR